jgi:hypothetical protein
MTGWAVAASPAVAGGALSISTRDRSAPTASSAADHQNAAV